MKPRITNLYLIIKYIERYGKITPAKVCGKAMWGGFFGSETPRECRLLRERGILVSERNGKFTTFYLA